MWIFSPHYYSNPFSESPHNNLSSLNPREGFETTPSERYTVLIILTIIRGCLIRSIDDFDIVLGITLLRTDGKHQ